MRLDESLFTCQCKNENRKAQGFKISHFHCSFSSDIMAVKGLSRFPWCLPTEYKQVPGNGVETDFGPNQNTCRAFIDGGVARF